MGKIDKIEVSGRKLPLDRFYDRKSHMWIRRISEDRVHCGMDSLAADSYGDIVALSFAPTGTLVAEGGEFGSLEAAKYVGPLLLPLQGVIEKHNQEVPARPGVVREHPYENWLVEVRVEPENIRAERFIDAATRVDDLRRWWEAETRRMKEDGVLCE